MPTITLNAAPGPLNDAPLGVAVALSEAGAFAGVVEAAWELTRPPGSAAALTVASPIGAAPFTNTFVPDVPGNYRARLLTTDASGAVTEATAVVRVQLPYALDTSGDETLPAPLEELEVDAAEGWAEQAARMLRTAHDRRGGAETCVFRNGTGGPLAAGVVVQLVGLTRWADLTGGGTGVPVGGAALDFVAVPLGGALAGTERENLHLVLADVADGARGLALRRGIVPWDTAGAGWAAGQRLYWGGNQAALSTVELGRPIARVWFAAAAGDNPPGVLWFDPSHVEDTAGRRGSATLANNTAAPADADAVDLAWPDTTRGVRLRYCVSRGASPDVQTGHIDIAISAGAAEAIVTDYPTPTTVAPGVAFFGAVAAGVATLQFTTTPTGDDADLRYVIEEVW